MIRYLLACLLAAAPIAGQVIQPGRVLALTPLAKSQLDSLAAKAATLRAEQSACVVAGGTDDTVYVLARIAPANHIIRSDSVSIAMDGPACEWWQPNIHTHVVESIFLETPSGFDYRTTALNRVFGFLLSVHKDSSWTLKSYP